MRAFIQRLSDASADLEDQPNEAVRSVVGLGDLGRMVGGVVLFAGLS